MDRHHRMGRVVVEAETADAAQEKVERKGYFVLQIRPRVAELEARPEPSALKG